MDDLLAILRDDKTSAASVALAIISRSLMSEGEKAVMAHLVAAVNEFSALPEGHPSDVADFVFHIHALQNMLGCRVAARLEPTYWRQPGQ